MDGIHDLGGMDGFGPVPVATGDRDFAEIAAWKKRMWGLARNPLAPGITIDWFRHGLERMVPGDYLNLDYFDKWCANYFMLMLDNGTITLDDVDRGHVRDPGPAATPVSLDDVLASTARADFSFRREARAEPVFRIGDIVGTHRVMPSAHTRLPRYARGAEGAVIAHHGAHALPDEGARGIERAEHLYTVAFAARDLWGDAADPRDEVTVDLWEPYLVRT